MHLWVISAVFGEVRDLQLKIKWFAPPGRCINHLELPYLVDLVAYLEWHLHIKERNNCTYWENLGVKDSSSARAGEISGRNVLTQYSICPRVTPVPLLGGPDGRDAQTLMTHAGRPVRCKWAFQRMKGDDVSSRNTSVLETDMAEFKY